MPFVPIDGLSVSTYTVPTDFPEADGTFEWNKTTLVLVEVRAGGVLGLGYTYANASTATLIDKLFSNELKGKNAMALPALWLQMVRSIRNLGRPGISSMAIAAVDIALWDLKAKILNIPLVTLLGGVRESVSVYGSGGFTSYPVARLQEQFAKWVTLGISKVKMKVGQYPHQDVERVRLAREAIGPETELFVDANGAYTRKQALAMATEFEKYGVTWFEEPVSSDDLEGLKFIRDRAPAGMNIAAGEYGYNLPYFRRMLEAEAVDILQADATRCAGITEFIKAASLCEARSLLLSAHTGPMVHVHPGCALIPVCHLEYFHDHARIEELFFEGTLVPKNGSLAPDLSKPGLGIQLRKSEARRFAA